MRVVVVLLGLATGCEARLADPFGAPDATPGEVADATAGVPDASPDAAPPCAGAVDGTSCFEATLAPPATWDDAAVACAARGAALAVVDSATANTAVETLAGGADVWLGGTDALVEGTWRWSSTAALVDDGYTNWRGNEPNDGGDGPGGVDVENCMIMLGAAQGGGIYVGLWDDRRCEVAYGYVCVRPAP